MLKDMVFSLRFVCFFDNPSDSPKGRVLAARGWLGGVKQAIHLRNIGCADTLRLDKLGDEAGKVDLSLYDLPVGGVAFV